MTDQEINILLAHFPQLTPRRYQALVAGFFNTTDFWQATPEVLQQKLAWKQQTIQQFLSWRHTIDLQAVMQRLEREQIRCVFFTDPDYPPLLKEIYDPPFCLFVRGELNPTDYFFAVVGTRKYTAYGKHVTERLVPDLARAGLTIVSGLALGIDSFAHRSTLGAGGKTIAVLGSGIDRQSISPRAHYRLSEEIIDRGGAVISEYPPGSQGTVYTFPARNRIIAGMSLGTLVVEAKEKSGALITSSCSLDMNREVFAVPGPVTSATSVGPHDLLRQGAHLVSDANDVLEVLQLQKRRACDTNKALLPTSPLEQQVISFLSAGPTHIDELVRALSLPSHELAGALALMEMKGLVIHLGGLMYSTP